MAARGTILGRSLAAKLALAIALVAAVLSGGTALVLDRTGSRAVDENSVEHMEVLAGALEGSFHAFDADRKAHPVADIVAEIGRHPAVDQLQVFDAQRRVRHSLHPEQRGQVLSEADVRTETPSAGSDDMVMVRYFPLRTSCTGCHQGEATAGGVRLVVDRGRLQSSLLRFRFRLAYTGAAILAALVLVAVYLMRRMVLVPVRELASTMARAEEGNFLVRAPVSSEDEVGQLARAFNTMLAAITDMRAREVERQAEQAGAEAERRLAPQIDEKNRIIATKNTELQERVRELALLHEVTRSLTATLSVDEQLGILTRLLAERLGYQEFTLMLLDRAAALLRVAAHHGFPDSMKVGEMTFAVGEGIAGLVAQTGTTLVVTDTSTDSRFLADRVRFTPRGTLVSVPMISNGMVMGVLNVFRGQVDAFRRDEVEFIESIASQASLGLANARLFQEQVELSLTDALTSLPNRRALDARLEVEVARAQRYESGLCVLMVDVDHFKLFNDAHGHLVGDVVLRGVAQTLCQTVRKADTVARFGGEEFCVLLPRQDARAAREVADKLRKAVRQREFEHAESQPGGRITISLGVASFPEHGQDVKALLDRADAALYAAKRAGRDRVMVAGEEPVASQPGGNA
ncbi:MAG: diguanylate cyclase [Deltaproteobacteria bacterium]|nr:diguanylate cyclase [Deltaproteobacteria bacterium]